MHIWPWSLPSLPPTHLQLPSVPSLHQLPLFFFYTCFECRETPGAESPRSQGLLLLPRWCAAAITKAAKEGMFAELKNQPCFCSRFYFKPQGAPGQWGAVNTSAGLSQGSGTRLHFFVVQGECKSGDTKKCPECIPQQHFNYRTASVDMQFEIFCFSIFCPPYTESCTVTRLLITPFRRIPSLLY